MVLFHSDRYSVIRMTNIIHAISRTYNRYKLDVLSCGMNFNKVRQCILSGFFRNAAKKDPQEGYKTLVDQQVVYVHPGSALFNRYVYTPTLSLVICDTYVPIPSVLIIPPFADTLIYIQTTGMGRVSRIGRHDKRVYARSDGCRAAMVCRICSEFLQIGRSNAAYKGMPFVVCARVYIYFLSLFIYICTHAH